MALSRKDRKQVTLASVIILLILYLSTPDLLTLTPKGILDSVASALLALTLSHVVLLLPRRLAIPSTALVLLVVMAYNVANGYFYEQQQMFLSVSTLYLAMEIMSLLKALPPWQLASGLVLNVVAFVVLFRVVRYARAGTIRVRLMSLLTLCSLSVVSTVGYAAIIDEARIRVGDAAPLGHMMRSSGLVPFTTLSVELSAKKERDVLIELLGADPDMTLPPKFSAENIGSLMGFDDTYSAVITDRRYPLFKHTGIRSETDLPKSTKATNVLLVVMESLRASEMGAYGAERSATPFLDELAQDNVVARRFYATANFTVKSEHAINCSTLDFMIGKPIAVRGLPVRSRCLPERLAENGYRTLWFHGNTKTFYNRSEYLPRIGFQELYSRDELDPEGSRPTLGWGLTDATVLDAALDRLEAIEQPFYAEILTVSNHMPFDFDWDIEFPDHLQSEAGTMAQYRRGMYYSDQALKAFHARFQRSELAEDTILVVTGDHGIWTFSSDQLTPLEKNERYFRVPLIVQTPEGHRIEVQEITSHLDIAPTLANLLELHGPDDWMGRSIFARHETLANRVTYLMTEQALSYRYLDRACIPSVQCQTSTYCRRTHDQQDPEALCYRVEPTQDLLLDPRSNRVSVVPLTADRDRALFEYSQIALELGSSPVY